MTTTVVRDSAPGRRYRGYGALWAFLILIVVGFGVYVAYHNRAEIAAWLSTDTDVVYVPPLSTGGGVTIDDIDNRLGPLNDRLSAVEMANTSLVKSTIELASVVKELKGGMATKDDVDAVNNRVDNLSVGIEEFKREYDAKHDEMAARVAILEGRDVVGGEVGVEEEPLLDPSTIWLDRIVAACPTADVTISWVRAHSEEELRKFLTECDSAPVVPIAVVERPPVAATPREHRPRVYTGPALTTSVPKEGGRVEHPYINRPAQYRCWIDNSGGRHRVATGNWRATGWCYGPSVN